MSLSRENGIFDDAIITSALHSDEKILTANFTFLVKRIFGITCPKNCKNMLKFA